MREIEVDLYGGIKPTWGPLTFDFGVLYYAYPGRGIPPWRSGDLDYIEFKAGVSGSPIANATLGATVYYSDDYFAETGEVWTVEGTAAYTFQPSVPSRRPSAASSAIRRPGRLTPTFNGFDSYTYWNAGLALDGREDHLRLPLLGYGWPDSAAAICFSDYCSERFVFSATVTLP